MHAALCILIQCVIFFIVGIALVMYTQTYVQTKIGQVAQDVDLLLLNYTLNSGHAVHVTSTPKSNALTVNGNGTGTNSKMIIGQSSFEYDAMAKNMTMSNGQSSISMSDGGKVQIMPSLAIGDTYKIVPNATGLQLCNNAQVCKQIVTA